MTEISLKSNETFQNSQNGTDLSSEKAEGFQKWINLQKIKKYGPPGFATYCIVSWSVLALIYMGVKRSGKANKIIKYLNLQNKIGPRAGAFAVSLAIQKILIPVRIGITMAVIPTVFRKFNINMDQPQPQPRVLKDKQQNIDIDEIKKKFISFLEANTNEWLMLI